MKFIIYAFVLLLPLCASAAEISLGGGYNFVTNDYKSGLGDTSTTSSGGLAIQAQILVDSGIENLKYGFETGYLQYSHAEYNVNVVPSYDRDEFNIPLLAVARFHFDPNFYGDIKAGIALDKISSALDSSGGNTTPYFAVGLTLGYSIMLSHEVSIDPRVSAYAFFISGAYTQVSPTLNFVYRL